MPNQRKPKIVRLSGRHYETPRPVDCPECPPDLYGDAKAVFDELVKAMPDGAAAKSDSLFIGLLAQLIVEYRRDPANFPAVRLNAMRVMLSELGMTPRARRQLELKADPAKNPFAEIDRLRGA